MVSKVATPDCAHVACSDWTRSRQALTFARTRSSSGDVPGYSGRTAAMTRVSTCSSHPARMRRSNTAGIRAKPVENQYHPKQVSTHRTDEVYYAAFSFAFAIFHDRSSRGQRPGAIPIAVAR